jgi:HTH-type transcriptional regulator / antitoxin HipB
MNHLIRSPKVLGTLIQTTRKKQGLSQAAFGELVGLHQSAVSLVEKGHAAIKLETLLSILAALDLDLTISPRAKGSIEDFTDLL